MDNSSETVPEFKGKLKFYPYIKRNIFLSVISLSDLVVQTTEPFEIYKLDCKTMISNADAFKLRAALLTMKFKKKSCDLYSFSQSADFNLIPRSQKPKEVLRFLDILSTIKENVSSYLKMKFSETPSVSCSKYDHGGNLNQVF